MREYPVVAVIAESLIDQHVQEPWLTAWVIRRALADAGLVVVPKGTPSIVDIVVFS